VTIHACSWLENGFSAQIFDSFVHFSARTASANTFITGFGLGFLAFGLKKLLLPFFLGAQLVKSILIAIFLPTILTSIGKFLGKSGASIFSASTGNGHHSSDDYDFKVNINLIYLHSCFTAILASAQFEFSLFVLNNL
jgi:hypothetical protein